MAQFDILELVFDLPASDDQRAELKLILDNPDGMKVDEIQQNSVPADVEVVAPGQVPTEEFWVSSNHYHLTVTLSAGTGVNPLEVTGTGFYNTGDPVKPLDIVVAEKDKDGKKKTRKVRRDIVYVAG